MGTWREATAIFGRAQWAETEAYGPDRQGGTKGAHQAGRSYYHQINSLTDRDVIDKLSQASRAGVRISLIIRGICCIVPGLVGKTENIEVRSIVGRFLEHTRVFCFGEGDEAEVFIGSADLMTRNTQRRVEIACPIYDKEIKRRIIKILQQQQKDNIKARELTPNGNYVKCGKQLSQNFSAQEYFMQQAVEKAKAAQQDGTQGFWSRLTARLSGRR